jgi:sec-independent protein translocase protein TatB
MFDIGWGELLVIAMVALIAIGPKELPGALRTLGQWMGKVRRMAGEFQNQFQDAIREAELHDLKKEVDDMAAKATSYTHFDPLDDVRKDIESAVGPMPPLETPPADSTAVSVTSTSSETPAANADVPHTPPAGEQTPAAQPPPSEAHAMVEAAPAPPAAAPPAAEPVSAAKPDAGKAPA